MKRTLPCLVLGLGLPLTAAALGEKPVLVSPYADSPCWVSIFDGKEFQPPSARLTGPTYLGKPETGPVVHDDLRNVGGKDFVDRIDSLIVGPRARITVYDQIRYSGNSLSFGPNERIPDLAAHGFENRIESIKVDCE